MTGVWLAVLLGLVSAVSLAVVNTAVKMGGDILVGRAVLSASAALLLAPAAFLVPLPDQATWAALAATLPMHLIYQFCLVRAMTHGDLSLVFPVMRGLAPLLTAVAASLLLGQTLTPAGWAALAAATGAILMFAWPPAGATLRRHPDARALLWAAGTAVGVALYNSTDARGVRVAPSPLTYIVWLFLLDWIGVTCAALLLRRRTLARAVAAQWRTAVFAGLLSILSFGSSLYAMSLIEAAKVSALRETSVVFAAAIGAFWLREGFGARRIAAATILAVALVALQFAG
jgi:drug/metabolite transporter (DMT)-like permease